MIALRVIGWCAGIAGAAAAATYITVFLWIVLTFPAGR